jgi:hypothetical protein
MSDTTSNQKRVVATKGTAHIPKTSGATDIGINPANGAQAPFPNQVPMALLKPGTSNTFIADKPIWTKPHQVGPVSAPVKAPFIIGKSSGTHIEEAKATSYSSDVFAEGSAVVRTNDTTTQNHGNTVGYVDGSALGGKPGEDESFLKSQCTIIELTGENEADGEAEDGFSVGVKKVARQLGYPGKKEPGVPPYYIEILSSTEVTFKAVRKDVTKPSPANPKCWRGGTHTKWLAKRTGEGACDAEPLEGKDEYTVPEALTKLLIGNKEERTVPKGLNSREIGTPKETEHVSDLHRNRPGNSNLSVKESKSAEVEGILTSLEAVFAYFLYWAMPVNINVQAISCGGSRNAQIRVFPAAKVEVKVAFEHEVDVNLTNSGKMKSGQKAMAAARATINKLRGIEWLVKKFAELSKKNVSVKFCSNMEVSFEVQFKPCAEDKTGRSGKEYTTAHVGMPWKVGLETPVLLGIEVEFEISVLNFVGPGICEAAATGLRRIGVKADIVFKASINVPLSVSIGADEYGFFTSTGVEVALKPELSVFLAVGSGINLFKIGVRFPGSLSAAFTVSDKPKVLMQLQPKGELKTIGFLTILEDTWFEKTWEGEWEAVRINWVGPKYDIFTHS